jgi:hypothetical protein
MGTGVTGAKVRAHPRRYGRKYLVIPVCGLRLLLLQPLHSANGVPERIVVYFDTHRVFRNLGVLTVLAVLPLNLVVVALALSQLVPCEFEEVPTPRAI